MDRKESHTQFCKWGTYQRKVFPAYSTLQNKNNQAISKIEHMHTISCKAQTRLKWGSVLWLNLWFLDRLLWLLMRAVLASKCSSSQSLWPWILLRTMHVLNIMGPWQTGTPFGFCCDLGTGFVLAPAQTKTGGLCSLIDSGQKPLLLGTSASQEGLMCCVTHLCPSPVPQHTLHAGLSLAIVWSDQLLQLHECLKVVWLKRGHLGFFNESWKKWNCDDEVPLESYLLHCIIPSSTTVCKFFNGFYWDLM